MKKGSFFYIYLLRNLIPHFSIPIVMKKPLLIITLLAFTVFANAQNKDAAKKDTTLYTGADVEVPAEYPGGLAALYKYFGESIVYPLSARNANLRGKVYLGFIIEKKGSISNLHVLRGLSSDVDAEAIRVMKDALKWSPAKQGGLPVRQEMTVPITFSINTDTIAEVMPPHDKPAEYPGGMPEFYNYLVKKLKYPAKAKTDKIEGTVYITFIVEKEGFINSVRVQKSVSPEMDAEAVRLVSTSRAWNPALGKDKMPVRQKFTVPVKFNLADAK